MFHRQELSENLNGAFHFLLFSPKASECYSDQWGAAWRSFLVILFLLPFWWAMTWHENQPYFAKYQVDPTVYLSCQFVGNLVAMALSFGICWLFAISQGVAAAYPRAVAAGNWFALSFAIVSFPLWVLVTGTWLDDHTRSSVSIAMYVLGLFYRWFIVWRCLKINPFVAVGFAILGDMPSASISDIINMQFYGVARPFFAP